MAKHSYTSAPAAGDAPDFEVDGVTFTCTGAPSVLDLSEFARLATEGVDSESPQGAAIVAQVFLAMLGEDEYQRFRNHCRKHGTDGETLVAIIGDMIAEYAERPTSRPSSSPDGPQQTEATAKVVSFSRGTTEAVAMADQASAPEPTRAVVSYG